MSWRPDGYPAVSPCLGVAGATSLQEPVRKDDQDRRGGVRDPAGNDWWLATQEG